MFLATTAVQEFWDKKKGKIFISGEWCRLYKENYNVELKCLPYQWDDYEKVYKAQIYCAKIFESTIVSLTSSLNAYLGLDKEESDEILKKIFEHQARLELTCRFTWTENTVCIWDNRSVIHFAIADFYPGRGLGYERVMDRIAIEGDHPQ